MSKRFPKSPIYELNPYTDVDKLAKSILGIETNYVWADLGEIIPHFGQFKNVCITYLKDNRLLFTANQILFIANQIVSNPKSIHCFLKDYEGKEEILDIVETFEEARIKNSFIISLSPDYKNKNLHIRIDNEALIFEL